MLKINFKRKRKKKNDSQFALEIVEILEEKIENMNIKLPQNLLDRSEEQVRFRKDIRNELVYEISDLISINKRNLISETT